MALAASAVCKKKSVQKVKKRKKSKKIKILQVCAHPGAPLQDVSLALTASAVCKDFQRHQVIVENFTKSVDGAQTNMSEQTNIQIQVQT